MTGSRLNCTKRIQVNFMSYHRLRLEVCVILTDGVAMSKTTSRVSVQSSCSMRSFVISLLSWSHFGACLPPGASVSREPGTILEILSSTPDIVLVIACHGTRETLFII